MPIKKNGNGEEDLFSPDNQVQIPFATWQDKETKKPFIGRCYRGIYVQKEVTADTLSKESGATQVIYTLVQARMKDPSDKEWKEIDGGILKVAGRVSKGPKLPKTLPALEIIPFGIEVGIKFIETMKSKKPGFSDAKIIRIFKDKNNTVHHDILDDFLGINPEDTSKDETL